jgi:DNA topoisomerase-2
MSLPVKEVVDEEYERLSDIDHVLERPSSYIGSVEMSTCKTKIPIYDKKSNKFVIRSVLFNPGLLKIFDEILVNAADNRQKWKNTTQIKFQINRETAEISVWNNGRSVQVKYNEKEKMWTPQLIFGELRTSSNYKNIKIKEVSTTPTKKRKKTTVGGTNGIGAKATNVFSKKFTVEICDPDSGLLYTQTWTNNMKNVEPPKIEKTRLTRGYTKVTFIPDLGRFKMTTLDMLHYQLMRTRVWDLAGACHIDDTTSAIGDGPVKKKTKVATPTATPTATSVAVGVPEKKKPVIVAAAAAAKVKKIPLTVYWNDVAVSVKSWKDYCGMYLDDNVPRKFFSCGRWEVCVSPGDGDFQQISFVNAIKTTEGGTHVSHIVNQITKSVATSIEKKEKGETNIKREHVKNYLKVFVNCLLEEPKFDSQTKTKLDSGASEWGSSCKLSDSFLKLVNTAVSANVLAYIRFRQEKEIKKTDGKNKRGRITDIEKLEDANLAGTKDSKYCFLILTEGDSAKALAMSGLGEIGQDYYGVFPLRGKMKNVRDDTHTQLVNSEELKYLKQILNLETNKEYDEESISSLRYGHVIIFADQDVDGSHIKGLVINLFHRFWPSLLKIPNFLQEMITPIVKVVPKGTNGLKGEEHWFYSLAEYDEWKKSISISELKEFSARYYKGLGTSTPILISSLSSTVMQTVNFLKWFFLKRKLMQEKFGFLHTILYITLTTLKW